MPSGWHCNDCGFCSKTRKGCMIHITKKHTYCNGDTMQISSACPIKLDNQPIAGFTRDWHRYNPLLCRRPQKPPDFSAHHIPIQAPVPSSIKEARCRVDPKEADCHLPRSEPQSKPNDEDLMDPRSSSERVDSPNSSASAGFDSCTTNSGPFPCDFEGLCLSGGLNFGCPASQPTSSERAFNLSKLSGVLPMIDQSDSFPGFASCHAQGPCDAAGSSRRFQTTVESQTHYRRIIRTKRPKERHCGASPECTAHPTNCEPAPLSDFWINSRCESSGSDVGLLRKLWPTRFSEDLALPRNLDLPGQSVGKIEVCLIFTKLLGDCVALDFQPANKWDIVVRCSICGKPLGGMQNIEDHVKEHLELVGHECRICDLPRVASDDAPHHHESCCGEDDNHKPMSPPTDIPAADSP